jgi:spore coat protein F
MYKKGYYPSYDLVQLLNNDLKNAQKALSMDY